MKASQCVTLSHVKCAMLCNTIVLIIMTKFRHWKKYSEFHSDIVSPKNLFLKFPVFAKTYSFYMKLSYWKHYGKNGICFKFYLRNFIAFLNDAHLYVKIYKNKFWHCMYFHSFPTLILLYYTRVDTSETTPVKLLFWF